MAVDLMHEIESSQFTDIELGQSAERVNMLETYNDDDFFDMKTTLKNHINQIHNNATMINQYTDRYKISTSTSEYDEISKKIDIVMHNNSDITKTIRNMINNEKNKICRTEKTAESIKVQGFNNLVQSFRNETQSFQYALATFDKAVRDKQMRQIHFLYPNLEEEKKQDLENGSYQQRQKYVEQALEISDETLQRLEDLEDQHDRMVEIEKSIKELKELYEHLNILVVDQGMLIDHIEDEVNGALEHVHGGLGELRKADKKQKENIKMKCWCLFCLLLLIAVVILIFVFRDSWN